MPYVFTQDWFYNKEDVFRQALESLEGKAGLRYLEVGVFEGKSLLWMFENVLTHETCQATVIDSFEMGSFSVFQKNLEIAGETSRTIVLKGRSAEELRSLEPELQFDVIYIDGSHRMKNVLEDLILSWPLLKEDGVLLLDDYLMNEGIEPIDSLPKAAIDCFMTAYRWELEVIHRGYCVALKKSNLSLRETMATALVDTISIGAPTS